MVYVDHDNFGIGRRFDPDNLRDAGPQGRRQSINITRRVGLDLDTPGADHVVDQIVHPAIAVIRHQHVIANLEGFENHRHRR